MPRKTHNSMIIRIKQRRLSLYFLQDRRLFIVMNGGVGEIWTPVLWWHHDNVYMLVPSMVGFIVSQLCQWTGGFATTPTENLAIKPLDKAIMPGHCPRFRSLVSVGRETSPQIRQRVRTLRSLLFFWPMFYEANDHPRHAIETQHIQSNPERPHLW